MGESFFCAEARGFVAYSAGSLYSTSSSYRYCAVLGRVRGDAILGSLGWLAMALRPGRTKRMRAALSLARAALDADWPVEATLSELAANTARFAAHDYLLDRLSNRAALDRFDVRGYGASG